MKLAEFFSEPPDLPDPMQSTEGDEESLSVATQQDKRNAVKKPRSDSNIERAKRIRSLARMKAKEADAEDEDTPYQYNLGGHEPFLFR